MKYDVRIAGKTWLVEVEHHANGWRARVEGQASAADAVEIAANTFSVLLSGRSHEVCVMPRADGELNLHVGGVELVAEVVDPRSWSGRRHAGLEAEGRQQIVAPMPGKVVRVLIKAGEAIQAGQGLLVVEAMKMQNEIRSPKSGKVERVLVQEGQAVNSGEVLAIVS